MAEKKILRCAVYTRKSTEEGLDMDYNTLDAQREAGEKYIEAMSDLVHDVFSHEGDMDFAYMHEDFLSTKKLQKKF